MTILNRTAYAHSILRSAINAAITELAATDEPRTGGSTLSGRLEEALAQADDALRYDRIPCDIFTPHDRAVAEEGARLCGEIADDAATARRVANEICGADVVGRFFAQPAFTDRDCL